MGLPKWHSRESSFGSTYTKIGTIQRRLAWPLCKDDRQILYHLNQQAYPALVIHGISYAKILGWGYPLPRILVSTCYFRFPDRSLGKESWVSKIRCRRDRLTIPVFLGFPCGSAGKESACNSGDLGSISGLGRSLGEGNDNPVQYSCLKNSVGRRASWATVHGVT